MRTTPAAARPFCASRVPYLFAAGVVVPVLLLAGVRPRVATAAPSPGAQPGARLTALLDRPRVAPEPKSEATLDGGFTVERGSFRSEAHERVPFLLMKPAGSRGRLATVIVLHGTGGNKERMADTLRDLAGRGLLALAIDGRYFGERVPGGAQGSEQYQDAILRAWREPDRAKQGHPFFYDTVYDVWRLLDYLETRPDVDAKRIGCIGFSKGGIETWLAAAADSRIRVAVPCIAVQSFRWSLEHDEWQGRARTIQKVHDEVAREIGEPGVNQTVCRRLWNKILPGILDEFDGPSLIPTIAPRPLLIVSGEKDPNCPLGGAELAFQATRRAYAQAGAADRLVINVAAGVAHQVTEAQRRMAYDWLVRWLK